MSWIPPRKIDDIEHESNEGELNNDSAKIYKREIHLAVLQSNDLEWIYKVCSREQREELLDKLEIVTAAIYVKTLHVDCCEELIEKRTNHRKLRLDREKTKKISIEHDCYAWTSINTGKLIINELIELRSEYTKDRSDERPMSAFIKLNINTIYGDIVSP